jgi:hypothetical protein
MKTYIRMLMAALCLLVTLSAFASKRDTVSLRIFSDEIPETTGCFVQYKDGRVERFTTLKLITGVFSKPHLLADGKIEILPAQIKAYKDNNYYALSQTVFYTKVKGHVASDVLPGFAIRVIKGTLNVFSLQLCNGTNIYKKYFLQVGNSGEIVPYSAGSLKECIKNNNELLNAVNDKKKLNEKDLLETVDSFNSTTAVSIN